jgi:two-component system NtrC family sensor kinase
MTVVEDRDRFQIDLATALERIDEPDKIARTALSLIVRHFGAEGGTLFLRHPVSFALRAIEWGRAGHWDEKRVRAFLDQERPDLGPTEIMAPVLPGGRAAGVLALRRPRAPFDPGDGRYLTRLCRRLARELALREERRTNQIVDRIKDRAVRELRPQDLFYQILHGLRALTRYDHSSALLIAEEDGSRLVLHAEQIAWAKGRSRRVGKKIRVPREQRATLRRATAIRIVSFAAGRGKGKAGDAAGAASVPGAGEGAADLTSLARLLRWGGKRREPAEGTILLAPLHHDGEALGLLKIAARHPGALGAPEAEAVGRVVRHVASVIHNARRALSMEERIIEAEKKHAMADLARAISHDVKNAIGAILPLAQQAREEVVAGTFDPGVLAQDLQQIEQSAQICQRIFDGMLQLARSTVHPAERVALSRVLDAALAVLGTRLRRAGVTLEARIPDSLPEVRAARGGLEQMFLNLLTNALDSMPAGGRLRITARVAGPHLEVKVADNGSGIPPERLKRIHEPFYTTKEDGYGLGLSIVRSILWENGGEMAIESEPGRGTTVTVTLPLAPPEAKPAPAEKPAAERRATPGPGPREGRAAP